MGLAGIIRGIQEFDTQVVVNEKAVGAIKKSSHSLQRFRQEVRIGGKASTLMRHLIVGPRAGIS